MFKPLTALCIVAALACPAHARRHSGVAQRAAAERLQLPWIADDQQLADLIAQAQLVHLESTAALLVDTPERYAYLRPWAANFLYEISDEFYQKFGVAIKVNSAVRPVAYQRSLRRRNSNAVPPQASVHPTGIAFDLQRKGLSRPQIRFVNEQLRAAQRRGRILFGEERLRQSCFHVAVIEKPPDSAPDVNY